MQPYFLQDKPSQSFNIREERKVVHVEPEELLFHLF